MITSDEILGKEAIDSEGDFLGIVMKLHLDPIQKTILGISIDPGLWRPDLYIGIDFVKQFGVDAIFLSAIPNSKYKSLTVFTYEGNNLGKIIHVNESNSNKREFVVQMKLNWMKFYQKRKCIKIPESSIQELGHSIVLKKNVSLEYME